MTISQGCVQICDFAESGMHTADTEDLSCTYLAHHELESVLILLLLILS